MLLGGGQAKIKQVAVITRNLQFNKLLSSILADWRFFAVEDLSAAKVIFAERGIELPEHNAQVIWLSPMLLSEENSLETPICLTTLYHLLEAHLFPTPRRHIRIAMETDLDLKIGEDWYDGSLVSLSNRGGRIACTREMPRSKSLDVAVKLAGRVLRIPAKVLYYIPAGDFPGRSQPHIGVLFQSLDGHEFEMLRRFIEKTCIERACAREDIQRTAPCLSWLDVPEDPWETSAG